MYQRKFEKRSRRHSLQAILLAGLMIVSMLEPAGGICLVRAESENEAISEQAKEMSSQAEADTEAGAGNLSESAVLADVPSDTEAMTDPEGTETMAAQEDASDRASGSAQEVIPEPVQEEPDGTEVTSVAISRSELSLAVGETARLSAFVYPETAELQSVTWQSEDASVASVDADGTVSAKKAGTAKITVTTEDGGLTAGCTVTVTAAANENTGGADSVGEESVQAEDPAASAAGRTDGKKAAQAVPAASENEGKDAGSEDGEDSSKGEASQKSGSANSVRKASSSSEEQYETTLKDGEYSASAFSFEGGTGKAKITLDKVQVKDGIATGVFSASSKTMTHVFYGGHTGTDSDDNRFYNPDSDICGNQVLPIKNQKVSFPVKLNQEVDVACRTTAMSSPHWVQYQYKITLAEPTVCNTKISVKNQKGGTVSGASVTVRAADGTVVSGSGNTFGLKPKVTYTVTASAAGYDKTETKVSVRQDGKTVEVVMKAATYPVTIAVKDADTGEDLSGMNPEITVKEEATGNTLSGSGGVYRFEDGSSYTVTVMVEDYESLTLSGQKAAGEKTIEVALKPMDEASARKCGLRIRVVDASGAVISGAKAEVFRETSTQTSYLKEQDGAYPVIAGKIYTVKVSADGYTTDSRKVQLTADKTETFTLEKVSCPVHVRVIDKATQYNLSKAVVTVKDGSNKVVSGKSGTWQLPYGTTIAVTASCTGYQAADGQVYALATATVKGEQTVTLELVKKTFQVKVSAVDSSSGKAVSGAKITVKDGDTDKAVAESGGAYKMTYGAVYSISASASGYASASVTHKATANTTVKVKLESTSSDASGSSGGKKSSASSKASKSTSKETAEKIVDNGKYTVKFKDAENYMFNVRNVVLHAKDGAYTADITLSATGYDYVYPGTKKEAQKAGKKKWSEAWNKTGTGTYKTYKWRYDGENGTESGAGYKYTIDVPYLNEPFILASRSIKYASDPTKTDEEAWRDGTEGGDGSFGSHEITIYSKYASDGKNLPTHKGVRKASSVKGSTDSQAKSKNVSGSGSSKGSKNSSGTSGKTSSSGSKTTGSTGSGSVGGGSSYATANNGSTGAVNNQSGLSDGTYAPDSFSFSGGTGKLQITCDQIIIKDGKTYARLIFSSTYIQYVKAGGQKITDYTRGASSTSFVVPVELNKNNKILALTTKMSSPHEVEYTIFIGLEAAKTAGTGSGSAGAGGTGTAADGTAGAASGDAAGQTEGKVDDQYDKLDEKAPEIMGLTYEKEIPMEHAELVKLFQYKDGYTLMEMDVRKKTALDETLTGISVDLGEEEDAGDNTDNAVEGTSDEEAGASDMEQTASEQKAALYSHAIYKYLVVPEGAEVPAGIDKQLFVIQLPVDQAAVVSKEALNALEALQLTDQIAGIGVPSEEIEDPALQEIVREAESEGASESESEPAEAAKKDAADDDPGETVSGSGQDAVAQYIGTYDKLDYKTILMGKMNLLLESEEILPHPGTLEGFPEKTAEEFAKLTDGQKVEFAKIAAEQAEEASVIGKRCVQLGMAMVIDRSEDEESNLGAAEWVKVYGALYGKETEADALYVAAGGTASDQLQAGSQAAASGTASDQLQAGGQTAAGDGTNGSKAGASDAVGLSDAETQQISNTLTVLNAQSRLEGLPREDQDTCEIRDGFLYLR